MKVTTYKIKFNIEGGQSLEMTLDKEQFEKMSEFCDKEFPNKKWETESLNPIEA